MTAPLAAPAAASANGARAFELAGLRRHALAARPDRQRGRRLETRGAERRDHAAQGWTSRDITSPITPMIVNGVVFAASGRTARHAGGAVRARRRDRQGTVEQRQDHHVVRPARRRPLRRRHAVISRHHDGTSMPSASRSNTKRAVRGVGCCCSPLPPSPNCPPGPARRRRRSSARSATKSSAPSRRARTAPRWQATIDKMVGLGAKGTDKEFALVLDYLANHYPADEVPRLNVNKARAIELESALSLPRSQAAAIIEYRTKHGAFQIHRRPEKGPRRRRRQNRGEKRPPDVLRSGDNSANRLWVACCLSACSVCLRSPRIAARCRARQDRPAEAVDHRQRQYRRRGARVDRRDRPPAAASRFPARTWTTACATSPASACSAAPRASPPIPPRRASRCAASDRPAPAARCCSGTASR